MNSFKSLYLYELKDILEVLWKIYDGTILRNYLTAKDRYYFCKTAPT